MFCLRFFGRDSGSLQAVDIRIKLIESGIISQMVTLPTNLFISVTLPATLWFFDKTKPQTDKKDTILFIDARNVFTQVDRAHRKFSDEQIKNLSAENIYYYLKSSDINKETLELYKTTFQDDFHKIWYKNKNFAFFEFDDDEETVEARSIYKKADSRTGLSNESNDKIMYDAISGTAKEEKDEWSKVTPTVASDIEALKKQGYMSGADTQILKSVTNDRYDYSKFLKKFIYQKTEKQNLIL